MSAPGPRTGLGLRLIWFTGLWVAGVAALATVAAVIRFALAH